MTNLQINRLRLKLSELYDEVAWKSTHISWIILCPEVVYKLPKPVRLPYLDFSSLEQRQLYCENEVRLNRRLTQGVYLEAVPVWQNGEEYGLENPPAGARVINYAVKMKRLPQERLMRIMLQQGQVASRHVEALARQIANFHQTATLIARPPDVEQLQEDFADLRSSKAAVASILHEEAAGQIEEWIYDSQKFLQRHEARLLERHQLGYYREIHGDLHAENIFLLEAPVVFDCIAFNDAFRQDDVLNELAFFCMDMDYYRQSPLGHQFLQHYLELFPCLETEEDQLLFLYYKLYRANVRLKVSALKWEQSQSRTDRKKHAQTVRDYYWLMRSYARLIFRRTETPV